MGVAAKKRKMAKHKFPWTKIERSGEGKEKAQSREIKLKRNIFVEAMR